ncbi:MAG: hypothetical protein ACHQYP_05735 [Nitrospiria bacterium]
MPVKKTILLPIMLMTVLFWSPQAKAIPAFARQTHLECSTCHFQHYPVLNKFGRAFKSQGYVMLGQDTKAVEGQNNLSIPATLNAAVIGTVTYQKTNGSNPAPTPGVTPTNTSNDGLFSIPQQIHLYLGGRISDNIGFIAESCLEAACTSEGGPLAGIKIPFLFNVGDAMVGAVPFSYGQGGAGVAYGFELLNTGAVAIHAFNQQDMASISAQQYVAVISPMNSAGQNPSVGQNIPASGISFVANHEIGFINFTKWEPSHMANGTNGSPTSNYFRIAAIPPDLVQGWDIGFGSQIWAGSSAMTSLAEAPVETNAFAFDAQFLGLVGKLPLTIITSYAKARGNDPLDPVQNIFNNQAGNVGAAQDRSSFNIGAEVGILSEIKDDKVADKLALQLGIRFAKSGINETGVSPGLGIPGAPIPGTNATDNALMVGATYEIAQNMKFTLTFSNYSGTYYNDSSFAKSAGGAGDQQIWVAMEAGW